MQRPLAAEARAKDERLADADHATPVSREPPDEGDCSVYFECRELKEIICRTGGRIARLE
jgi:hypothetical protein